MEEPHRRFAASRGTGHERRPDYVNAVLPIDRDGRTILRTPIDRPLVLAHAHGWRERLPVIAGHREGDVPDVAGVHVPPRRVDGSVRSGRQRSLAAVADAA